MRPISTGLATGAAMMICASAAILPTSPALASTTATTLSGVQAEAAAAISVRESALQEAVSAYTSNPFLTSADRSAILTTLDSDLAGLQALAPVIQADTTLSKALSDYRTIFTQYRVFALALPQSRFAASADDLTGTVVPHLTDAQSRLQALLAGSDSNKNTPAVQAAMADLASQISAMTTATNGLAATVLAYTPPEWNANRTLLAQPRADLVTARADARTARHDVATVVAALQ